MLPVLAIAGKAAGAVVAGSAYEAAKQIGGGALMATVFNVVKNNMSVSSLADLTKPARVEPLAIIDATIIDQPYMQDILKLALSNFAGYYLQAVNMICGVGRIDTLKVFDSLNPDRTYGFDYNAQMKAGNAALESYRATAFDLGAYSEGLPSLEAFSQKIRPTLLASLEDASDDVKAGYERHRANNTSSTPDSGVEPHDLPDAGNASSGGNAPGQNQSQGGRPNQQQQYQQNRNGNQRPQSNQSGGKDNDDNSGNGISSGDTQKIYEVENLAVGKLINVELKDGDQKAKLPVLIRLIPAAVPPSSLVHIFTAGGRDSWATRMFLVKTGQIKFWRDFVLGQDMIDEHFKALVNDKSGVYKTITDRRRNNAAKSVQSGRVSMADASNIAVVSAATLKQSTNRLYGKIEQESVRKAIFDNSYLLMLIIVDEHWQRVTIYHRGIDLATHHRFDEIKMSEKSKGPDITDIFKMFNKSMQTNI